MMRAAQVHAFGSDVSKVLTVEDGVAKPQVGSQKEDELLVKVLASSLSPADWRTMTGSASAVRHPAFPYIPGHDVCGIVQEVPANGPNPLGFKKGDCILGTWEGTPYGGISEYVFVKTKLAVHKPKDMSVLEASASTNSSIHAISMLQKSGFKQGDRVLVLGGAGGVGTTLIQLLKAEGAGFIATTTTQAELVKSLGADESINYNEQDWSQMPAFREQPFDLIFDLAEGKDGYFKCSPVLQRHGKFVAVHHDAKTMTMKTYGALFTWFVWTFGRSLRTKLNPFERRYYPYLGAPNAARLAEMIDLYTQKKFRPVVHNNQGFAFTTEGVRDAFQTMLDRRAHGKVVIQVAEE